MKLIITLIGSVTLYFGLDYFGLNSIIIWILLIVVWAMIDYFYYQKPFTWTDYGILVIVLSIVELNSWYHFLI